MDEELTRGKASKAYERDVANKGCENNCVDRTVYKVSRNLLITISEGALPQRTNMPTFCPPPNDTPVASAGKKPLRWSISSPAKEHCARAFSIAAAASRCVSSQVGSFGQPTQEPITRFSLSNIAVEVLSQAPIQHDKASD